MKKWILFASIFLSSLALQAQSLPDSLLSKVVDVIILNEHYVYKLNKQDSILTIYKKELKDKDMIIGMYKLNAEDYKDIVTKLEGLRKADQETIKDRDKKIFWHKVKEWALTALAAGELILITILVTK